MIYCLLWTALSVELLAKLQALVRPILTTLRLSNLAGACLLGGQKEVVYV
jgi:hypothetical protein